MGSADPPVLSQTLLRVDSPNLNMKSSLFCLLAVGLASCDLLFSPGQEYVYTYSGKILTGIPQVDSTFAGMSITGQVIVQATTAHIFKLAIRDVGFSTFNERLDSVEPRNWRTVATPTTNPLTDLFKKQYSKISPEAKLCDKLTIEGQKLRKQMKYMIAAPQKSILQQKFAQIMDEQVRACSIKEDQAFALDQSIIEVTTSETLPTFVYTFGKLVDSGLKAVLFPYIAAVPGMPIVPANRVVLKLNINQKLNTVSMHVQSPIDSVVFKNIRLPAEVKNIFSLIAKKSPIEQSYEAITGSPLFGKCILGQGFVQTFDKKTYAYQVDTCDHIITSDCSKEFNHAVLAKEINGQKHITVFYMMSKISLIPSLSSYKLEVDGQELSLIKNKMMYIPSKDFLSTFSVYWSSDNSIILETPAV